MIEAIAFIGLNILDAYWTKCNLARGALELNRSVFFGDNMLVKGLLALAAVVFLYCMGWEKWLLPMSIVMIGIVAWNFFMLWL